MPLIKPHFKKTSDDLLLDGVSLKKIAADFGTPTYVYSAARIAHNYRRLAEAFQKHSPSTHTCYAIKANSNPEVLKIIQQAGGGADCSTDIEIDIAQAAGFDLTQCLFTSVNPTDQDIQRALQAKIIFNLDDHELLDRVLEMGRPEHISFRINPGIGAGKFQQIVVGGKGSKFGISESRAIAAYQKAYEKGYRRAGIYMMTGSCILEPEYFERITQKLLEIAGAIRKAVPIEFTFFDIGGGFGIPYEEGEPELNMEDVARRVCETFERGCREFDLGSPQLMLEPGRYIVGDSAALLTTVTHIKHEDKIFAGCDAGMTALIRPALYGAYHEIINVGQALNALHKTYDVVGPICESTDCFAHDRSLPELRRNDTLAILDAGAYGYAMSSTFNGRLRPREVMIENGKARLIRERA